jgi:catechol-2,3-dioxygenase
MAAILTEVLFDAHDANQLAQFWCAVLGYEVIEEDDGDVEIGAPDRSFPRLLFLTVPDEKVVKNRVHIDVRATGCTQEEELERLLALGATHVDIGQGDQTWYVLADPEGNEFCLLRTRFEDLPAPD